MKKLIYILLLFSLRVSAQQTGLTPGGTPGTGQFQPKVLGTGATARMFTSFGGNTYFELPTIKAFMDSLAAIKGSVSGLYVPYTGASTNINLNGKNISNFNNVSGVTLSLADGTGNITGATGTNISFSNTNGSSSYYGSSYINFSKSGFQQTIQAQSVGSNQYFNIPDKGAAGTYNLATLESPLFTGTVIVPTAIAGGAAVNLTQLTTGLSQRIAQPNSPVTNDYLYFNGSTWVNRAILADAGTGQIWQPSTGTFRNDTTILATLLRLGNYATKLSPFFTGNFRVQPTNIGLSGLPNINSTGGNIIAFNRNLLNGPDESDITSYPGIVSGSFGGFLFNVYNNAAGASGGRKDLLYLNGSNGDATIYGRVTANTDHNTSPTKVLTQDPSTGAFQYSNLSEITKNAGGYSTVRFFSGTTTATSADYIIIADATSGLQVCNLPDANTVPGLVLSFKNICPSGGNFFRITPFGSQTTDGSNGVDLSSRGEFKIVAYNGNWAVIM